MSNDQHRKRQRDRQRTEWQVVAIETRRALLDSHSSFNKEWFLLLGGFHAVSLHIKNTCA